MIDISQHDQAKKQHQKAANLHADAMNAVLDVVDRAKDINKTLPEGNAAADSLRSSLQTVIDQGSKAAGLYEKAGKAHNGVASKHYAAIQSVAQNNLRRPVKLARSASADGKKAKSKTIDASDASKKLFGAVNDALTGLTQPDTDVGVSKDAVDQLQNASKAAAQTVEKASNSADDAADTGEHAAAGSTLDGTPKADPGANDPINQLVEWLGANGVMKTVLDHNRWLTVCLIVAAVVVVWARWGTVATVDNPFSDGPRQVTRAMLAVELQNYQDTTKANIADLQKQVDLKTAQAKTALDKIQEENAQLAQAVQTVSAIAVASAPATGPIGPLIGIVSSLAVAGMTADGSRKSAVLTKSQSTSPPSTDTTTNGTTPPPATTTDTPPPPAQPAEQTTGGTE